MRRGAQRLTALLSAALLCLSGWGCSIGGIRIEPLDKPFGEPPVNEPAETASPETNLPETVPPETTVPETEEPDAPEPVPAEPEPEPEPEPESSRFVRYTEEDFREKRGNGWVVKALSFQPRVVCPAGEGRFFAGGMNSDLSAVCCALVDPAAMAAMEAEVDIGPAGPGIDYRSVEAFCLDGEPFLLLVEDCRIIRLDPDDLSVKGSLVWAGSYQSSAQPLEDGRAVMRSGDNGRLMFISPSDTEPGIELTIMDVSLPEGFTGMWIMNATTDGMLLATINNGGTGEDWQQLFALIDSRTGEVTAFDRTDSVSMQIVGNCILEVNYTSDSIALHRPGVEMGEIRLSIPENNWLLWPNWNSGRERILFEHSENSSDILTVMDAETLLTVGQFTADRQDPWDYISVWGDTGDYVTAILYENGGELPRLFYWDWADIEAPAPAGTYPTLSNSKQAELRREIERIYEETGVSVYVGNEAVRYLYGYAVQSETDIRKQLEAVRSLTSFFDNCPPGFIRELTEWSSTIDICLTGKIIPEPGNRDSISDASAFVTPLDDCQVMVLDILQGGLTETVAHEFLHIAENAMWNMYNRWWEEHPDWTWDQQNPTDVFWYWSALNPPDFEYAMVYTDENGVTLGSDDPRVWNWETPADIDTVYFIDGYSTTYPKEDRARIFQFLATCEPDELPEAFRSEAIRKKAAYLCACLRRSFKSISEAEDVFWERSLNPEWDYEYFATNYDIVAQG